MTLVAPTPPGPAPYMTYLPMRKPTFKTHTNIGHVKNAIRGGMYDRKDMFAYEYIDGDYKVMWAVPAGVTLEELPWETKLPEPTPTRNCPHFGCLCNHS